MHEEFAEWFNKEPLKAQEKIGIEILCIKEFGPILGRPKVDSIKNSKIKNLKELRIQVSGRPYRILFVFDEERQAILLVGGDKSNDKKWYARNIKIAEKRYLES